MIGQLLCAGPGRRQADSSDPKDGKRQPTSNVATFRLTDHDSFLGNKDHPPATPAEIAIWHVPSDTNSQGAAIAIHPSPARTGRDTLAQGIALWFPRP